MITRIAIANFKAFRYAEINLSALTLFTGMNGMGKSTFIQSILLIKQSDELGPFELNGLKLKGNLVDIGKGRDAYSIHADSDFISFEFDEDYEPIINASFEYQAESDVLIPAHVDRTLRSRRGAFFNNISYLKAERMPPEHTYKANLSEVLSQRFLGYRGENTALYIAIHKHQPVSVPEVIHEKAKAPNLIANIDAWMNEITPGTHVISTYYNALDVVKLGYQFDTLEDSTPEFSPMNVGFGFTYILPVITAILSANKGDLLIIENPESHLHPRGQAKLGELIARAAHGGVQIIIESHSDHLFNGIRVAVKNKIISPEELSVFYFERDEKSKDHLTTIEQPVIDAEGRISHVPKGFFDEFANQLNELIK